MLYLTSTSTVVVIGPPGSGKTTVGRLLAERSGLPLYSTDNYLGDGHVAALYMVMKAIGDEGWIVEGMIGYRMLRKRKEFGLPAPDIVIELDATDDQIVRSYRERGKQCSLPHIRGFIKAHESVLHDYYAMDGEMPGIWIHSTSPHIAYLIGGGPDGTANNEASA